MALPNYAGKLLDQIVLLVIGQTGNVRPNPDETGYPDVRASVLKATAMALFKARNELQQDRRDEEARLKKARAEKA
jgi:hypothetical protein